MTESIPTDLDLARAANACYAGEAAGWERVWTDENIWVGLKDDGPVRTIAFRGSVTARDWLADFRGWPKKHPALGYCHEGFLEGMDAVALALFNTVSRNPVAITGHSLGAAHALICAALLSLHQVPIVRITTFGTPRPGFYQLSKILNYSGAEIAHYRNGPDPVAEVPFALQPFWPYQKPRPDIPLSIAPPNRDDPFAWHHMPLYMAGVEMRSISGLPVV